MADAILRGVLSGLVIAYFITLSGKIIFSCKQFGFVRLQQWQQTQLRITLDWKNSIVSHAI